MESGWQTFASYLSVTSAGYLRCVVSGSIKCGSGVLGYRKIVSEYKMAVDGEPLSVKR